MVRTVNFFEQAISQNQGRSFLGNIIRASSLSGSGHHIISMADFRGTGRIGAKVVACLRKQV